LILTSVSLWLYSFNNGLVWNHWKYVI
jgi:hypothetical protein